MNPNCTDNLKPFAKGDPRINRRGRPRAFDALRRLSVDLGREVLIDDDGQPISAVEKILRKWRDSKSAQENKWFLELAYGKVPDEINLGGNSTILIRWVDEQSSNDKAAADAPEAGGDIPRPDAV